MGLMNWNLLLFYFSLYTFWNEVLDEFHCVKSVLIQSFSVPYFLEFGLKKEIYSSNIRIKSECINEGPEKIRI